MSATELLIEKARALSEPEAKSVLGFIDHLQRRRIKASELMKLPRSVRHQILREQFADAEALYRDNPDLIMEDTEGPMGHD